MCDRILAIPDLAGLHRNEMLSNQRSLMEAAHPEDVNSASLRLPAVFHVIPPLSQLIFFQRVLQAHASILDQRERPG